MAEFDDIGYVSGIVKAMVDHPDDLKVSRSIVEMGVLLEVHAHPEDMGTIIGRDGQNAKALRTILRVVGARHDARLNLRIAEPEGGSHQPTVAPESEASQPEAPAETTPSTPTTPAPTADDVPTDVLA